MVIIITGASHSGKTMLAQKLLEKYKYPYLSIDHLKMGLIRSGNTDLSVYEDEKLVDYLWPIVLEMIKTAIENNQNLIVEGLYIPNNWKESFSSEYLKYIKFIALALSKDYIINHFDDIKSNSDIIEKRLKDDINIDELIKDNQKYIDSFKDEILIIEDNYEDTINKYLENNKY